MLKTQDFIYEMVKTSSIFGRDNVRVTFSGNGAYTDGKTINLPTLTFNVEMDHDMVLAWRGYVDHEAGHIRHSDMPLIMDFYKRCVSNKLELLKDLHNCIEDIWEENRVMRDYPGSRKNLRGLDEFVAPKSLEQFKEAKAKGSSMAFSANPVTACSAILAMGRTAIDNGSGVLPEIIKELPEELIPHAERWVEEILKCKNSSDTIDLAKSIWKFLEEHKDDLSSLDPEEFDPKSGSGMDVGDLPNEGDEEERRQLKQLVEEILADAKEILFGETGDEEMDAKIDAVKGIRKDKDGEDVEGWRIYSTEKDEVFNRNSTNSRKPNRKTWEHWGREVDAYERHKEELSTHVSIMKAKLKRAFMSYQRRDWEYNKENGRLDSRRLVRALGGNKNVFKRQKDREDVNTAVEFMVDLSGSMYGSRAEIATKACVAFAECLEGTGINYSISGFCNKGVLGDAYDDPTPFHRIEELDIYQFKDFNESLRSSRGWIGNIESFVGCNNSDPDAIYWSYYHLKDRPERRKVLLVLSDGSPACETHRVKYDALDRATKEAVKFVESKGIQTVGIGLQSSAVSSFYNEYVVVEEIDELSGAVFNKLSKLLLDGKVKL